jgi:hypothetical protein
LIGNKDEEGVGLPDRLIQRRLPKMAVSKMRLINKNVRAGNYLLDRRFESERAITIRRMVTQENVHNVPPQHSDDRPVPES